MADVREEEWCTVCQAEVNENHGLLECRQQDHQLCASNGTSGTQDDTHTQHHSNDVDSMLAIVGGFGPFQWTMVLSFCLMILPASYQVLIMYFLALQPGYRCSPNSTLCTSNHTFKARDPYRCTLPRSDWKFLESKSFSIVTQFDLYCSTTWLLDLTTGIYFMGAGLGGLLLGKLADSVGRRRVLFLSLACIIFNGFISVFASNIYVFIAQRFVSGLFYSGTLGQMVIMAAELVVANRRPLAGNSVWLFYSLASCILALKAYYIHDWRTVLVVCTGPYALVLLFYLTVPESARWLKHKGKTEQLDQLWKRIAKRNKRSLEKSLAAPILPSLAAPLSGKARKDESAATGFLQLFRPASFALRTLIQAYVWMTTSMIYYALSLSADELGGNLYRNFALVSIMECPGHICGAFLSSHYGRKKTAAVPMFASALACAGITLFPTVTGNNLMNVYRVSLGMCGKFFITACYSCIYLWSAEIFPTRNRAKGIGLMQVFEMCGGACAPFVVMKISYIDPKVPFLMLFICGVVASVLMVFLPETKSRDMK